MTTIASDWDDIGAVVDHLRALRHVERVGLVAWSSAGPRAGVRVAAPREGAEAGVAGAGVQSRFGRAGPAEVPAKGAAMNAQSHDEFAANWDRQVGCPNQYEPAASDAVWAAMLASDPVGATWGTGVRRAPQTTTWGWNGAVVAKMQTPMLMVTGAHDKQVPRDSVQDFVPGSGIEPEGFRGSRVFLAQRDVGEESSAAVPRVAGVAEQRHGEWDGAGDGEAGVLENESEAVEGALIHFPVEVFLQSREEERVIFGDAGEERH